MFLFSSSILWEIEWGTPSSWCGATISNSYGGVDEVIIKRSYKGRGLPELVRATGNKACKSSNAQEVMKEAFHNKTGW